MSAKESCNWKSSCESVSHTQSSQDSGYTHSLECVLSIRVENISFQTHVQDCFHEWKCMHTKLNTYNKIVALPLALQPS